MLGKILKHSVLYTVAAQVPMMVNLLLLPLISKFLTTEDYRIYGLVLAYVGLFSAFSSLGFIVLFQNSFFRDKENFKPAWQSYLGFQILYKLMYGVVISIVLYFVLRSEGVQNLATILGLIVVPVVIFDLTKSIGMRLCQYREQHHLVYISSVMAGLVSAAVTFYTVYHLRMGYVGWCWSAFAGGLVQWIYFGRLLYFKEKILPSFGFEWRAMWRNVKVALPGVPHQYSNYLLNTSDRLLLDWYGTEKQPFGQYNLAYGFASYFENFNGQINTVVSPIYFRLVARNDVDSNRMMRNITLVWFAGILMLTFLISLWSREIFSFLYRNAALSEAYPLMILVLMSFAYRPIYVASVTRAIYNEKTAAVMKITLSAAILNLVLNVLTIPFFGVWAAAANTFIAFLFMGLAGHFFESTKQYIDQNYFLKLIVVVWLLATAAAFFLCGCSVVVKAICSAMVLLASFFFYLRSGKQLIREINKVRAD